jgi:hypothetical protein
MYLHVRFPQEFHPKKKVLWYLFKVYVENEAMSSIYRGRFVMDSRFKSYLNLKGGCLWIV